jgi:hypothetical protein
MTARPGEIVVAFRLSGEPAKHLAAMAKEADPKKSLTSISQFAKSLLLEVIADDRAAHETAARKAAK